MVWRIGRICSADIFDYTAGRHERLRSQRRNRQISRRRISWGIAIPLDYGFHPDDTIFLPFSQHLFARVDEIGLKNVGNPQGILPYPEWLGSILYV